MEGHPLPSPLMIDPYARLISLGRATSNPAIIDVHDDNEEEAKRPRSKVTFDVPPDFMAALQRLRSPQEEFIFNGKEDSDARGRLRSCAEARDFFLTRCDPDDIRAIAMDMDVEMVRHDAILRKQMLIDLWRRTAKKVSTKRRPSVYAPEVDPFSRYIIHDKQSEKEKEEGLRRTPSKKRNLYYLTQLFQYAVRRMIWERRRLSNSSDPWDMFFYRAYAAKKPTEAECARRERRRKQIELVQQLTDEVPEEGKGRALPISSRRVSIVVRPEAIEQLHSSDSSSDEEAEPSSSLLRRPSLSEQMLGATIRNASSLSMASTPEILVIHPSDADLSTLHNKKNSPRTQQKLAVAMEKERIRRPSVERGRSNERPPPPIPPPPPRIEKATPALAIIRPKRVNHRVIETKEKEGGNGSEKKTPLLPPINPPTRRRSSTLPSTAFRSRSSPSSSRMRFGRAPRSPDGRNTLTRLFYLPLLPPPSSSSSSSTWAGNDIDRVIRALAT